VAVARTAHKLRAPAVRQPADINAENTRNQARGSFSRAPPRREFLESAKIRETARSRDNINNRGHQWYLFSEGRFYHELYKKPRGTTRSTLYPFLVLGKQKRIFPEAEPETL